MDFKSLQSSFTAPIYLFVLLTLQPFYAQRKKKGKSLPTITYSEQLYEALSYRSIGPHRGGRSSAVTGVKGQPDLLERLVEAYGKPRMEARPTPIFQMDFLEGV